jgi:hypothetical protein
MCVRMHTPVLCELVLGRLQVGDDFLCHLRQVLASDVVVRLQSATQVKHSIAHDGHCTPQGAHSTVQLLTHVTKPAFRKISRSRDWPQGLYFRLKRSKR